MLNYLVNIYVTWEKCKVSLLVQCITLLNLFSQYCSCLISYVFNNISWLTMTLSTQLTYEDTPNTNYVLNSLSRHEVALSTWATLSMDNLLLKQFVLTQGGPVDVRLFKVKLCWFWLYDVAPSRISLYNCMRCVLCSLADINMYDQHQNT